MLHTTLDKLLLFVTRACDAAVQEYLRGTDPARDRIKQSEAKKYLRSRGIMPVMLRRWTDAGLLTPVKSGDKQNCAVWYSLTELKQAICAIELKKICND